MNYFICCLTFSVSARNISYKSFVIIYVKQIQEFSIVCVMFQSVRMISSLGAIVLLGTLNAVLCLPLPILDTPVL